MATDERLNLIVSLQDKASGKAKQLSKELNENSKAAEKIKNRLDDLGSRYQFTARSMAIASQELQKLESSTRSSTTAVDRKKLQVDKLNASLEKLTRDAQQSAGALDDIGKKSSSASGMLGGFAGEVGRLAFAFAGIDQLVSGFKLSASLEQTELSLQTFLGSVEKGSQVYADAIAWGEKFGFTQQAIASALQAAQPILKQTNATTEETIATLAQLSAMNPAEGIEGASFSIRELISGDVTSMIERFNLSRDTVYEWRDAIRSGVDPVTYLSEELTKLGYSQEMISNRMEGQQGVINTLAQNFENTKLAVVEFLDAIGAVYLLEAFAVGLGKVAEGISWIGEKVAMAGEYLSGFDDQIAAINEKALANATTWQEYSTAFESAGVASYALTESQYQLAQALTAVGVGAPEAVAAVQMLNAEQAQLALAMQANGMAINEATWAVIEQRAAHDSLRAAFSETTAGAQLSTEAQQELIMQAIELASVSPEAAAGVEYLAKEFRHSQITAEEFAERIEGLTNVVDENGNFITDLTDRYMEHYQSTIDMSGAKLELTDISQMVADAQYEESAATFEAMIAKYDEEAATAELINREAELEAMGVAVYNGTLSKADAMAQLTNELGFNDQQAEQLINTWLRLNTALSGNRAQAMALAIGDNITTSGGKAARPVARSGVYSPSRREPKSARGSGRGAGSRGGKTDAQKAAEKATREAEKAAEAEIKAREKAQEEQAKIDKKIIEEKEEYHDKIVDSTLDYVQAIQEIEEKYRRDSKAAEEKFNRDKFSGRADYYTNVASMDMAFRAEALARETALWDEAQKIAQDGRAKESQAYLDRGRELIAADMERAAAMREIEQQLADSQAELTAEQRADLEQRLQLLQEADRLYDEQAAQELERLKNANDSLAEERDSALSEERIEYEEALRNYREQFDEAIDKATEKLAQSNDALWSWADNVAGAASRASAALASMEAAKSDQPTASMETRATGGPVSAGTPYLVGERGPEVFVPRSAGGILPASTTQNMGNSTSSTPVSGGSGQTVINNISSSLSFTFNLEPDLQAFADAIKGDMMQMIDKRLEKFSKDLALEATRRSRI